MTHEDLPDARHPEELRVEEHLGTAELYGFGLLNYLSLESTFFMFIRLNLNMITQKFFQTITDMGGILRSIIRTINPRPLRSLSVVTGEMGYIFVSNEPGSSGEVNLFLFASEALEG